MTKSESLVRIFNYVLVTDTENSTLYLLRYFVATPPVKTIMAVLYGTACNSTKALVAFESIAAVNSAAAGVTPQTMPASNR